MILAAHETARPRETACAKKPIGCVRPSLRSSSRGDQMVVMDPYEILCHSIGARFRANI